MLGPGDIYARLDYDDERALHATWYVCAGCGDERRGDADWHEYEGRDYCDECIEVQEIVVPCNECGSAQDVDDEIGLCRRCEWIWIYPSEEVRS